MFVLGDRERDKRPTIEIAGQDKGAVFLGIFPGKLEKSVLRFEITDLQGAVDLRVQTWPAGDERQLPLGEGQIVHALTVIEVGESIERELLGLG